MTARAATAIVAVCLVAWGAMFFAAHIIPLEALPLVLGVFTACAALVAVINWGLAALSQGEDEDA